MADVVIDFETAAIDPASPLPPRPVGVAILKNGRAQYWAWGHPSGNNCSENEARNTLSAHFKDDNCIFHNAAFDIEVARYWFRLEAPRKFEDTLFLAYLNDPREPSLALKTLGEKYLDVLPDEQNKLHAWIIEHIMAPRNIKPTRATPPGAYIAEAPAAIVAPYAKMDVKLTWRLYKYMLPLVKDYGMLEAYAREKRCLPIFMDMSREGIRIRRKQLNDDLKRAQARIIALRSKLRRKLKNRDVNIDSGEELADAMEAAGMVDEWVATAKGKRSVSRDNIAACCKDKTFVKNYQLYLRYTKLVSTFMTPWLERSRLTDHVYPQFSQVRTPGAYGGDNGTRTGRPSSHNPNFLNIPRNPDDTSLPFMRSYVAPDKNQVLLLRDYSQQEMRILAHFENDAFMQAYIDRPETDAHTMIKEAIYNMLGTSIDRKPVKTIVFGIVYGFGMAALANKLSIELKRPVDMREARQLKNTLYKAFPGIQQLEQEVKARAAAGEFITTWGGRKYLVEPPDQHGRSKEYKMLNYLIQGSAADVTKEAMIRVNDAIKGRGRIMLQVYDELIVSVDKFERAKTDALIKEAMESVEMDVPMLTEGKASCISWADAKKRRWQK